MDDEKYLEKMKKELLEMFDVVEILENQNVILNGTFSTTDLRQIADKVRDIDILERSIKNEQ